MTETTIETNEQEVITTEPEPSVMSSYAKLLLIRKEFNELGYKRSGKNSHAEFKYLELKDIIPQVNELMLKHQCVFTCIFSTDLAKGILTNLENVDDKIIFSFPYVPIAEPAKFRMNEAQATGACLTYYRRYLYFQLLDLVVNDDIEPLVEKTSPVPIAVEVPKEVEAPKPAPAPKKAKPATVEERKEAKEAITAPDEQANDLMITGLKNACAMLLQKDPTKKELVEAIKTKTEKFTKVSKSTCEQLTLKVNDLIDELTGIK